MIAADLSPLGNHLWQSTLCGAAAWMLTLSLGRNRAAVRYWLWMAASLKFLIPFALLTSAGNQLGWRATPTLPRHQIPVVLNEISRPFVASAPGPRMVRAPSASDIPEMLLLGVWLCGFTTGILCWIRWWRGIRTAQRTATPLDLHLPISVMSSQARLEPGVVGIWKPVLLLPEGIEQRLTPAQLEAVVAHELCHVRRHDNLTAAIHMLVEVIFWFHPLVWCIRARLMEERERACDEDVLSVIGDPQVYAEGIVNVCKFYLGLPADCVAGVTGSNLKRPIAEIMAQRRLRNLDSGRKLLLATVGLTAVTAPIVIGMLDTGPLRGQPQPGDRPAFAVASIKEDKSGDPGAGGSFPSLQFLSGGRFVARNMPLLFVIADAYHLPFQSERLTGGPDWIRGDRYDIEAAAEEGAIPRGASAKVRDEKMRLMLQTLLAERFKMTLRREIQELPVYAIVVRKGGPRLEKAGIQEKDCVDRPTGLGDADSCHSFEGGQGRGLHASA
jgi:beta-lactamase regulating signal transducer with metallopeptidase domain